MGYASVWFCTVNGESSTATFSASCTLLESVFQQAKAMLCETWLKKHFSSILCLPMSVEKLSLEFRGLKISIDKDSGKSEEEPAAAAETAGPLRAPVTRSSTSSSWHDDAPAAKAKATPKPKRSVPHIPLDPWEGQTKNFYTIWKSPNDGLLGVHDCCFGLLKQLIDSESVFGQPRRDCKKFDNEEDAVKYFVQRLKRKHTCLVHTY